MYDSIFTNSLYYLFNTNRVIKLKLFSWITNIGETFLTQHRDMGVDIAYVSDYVDNHQQMKTDLKVYKS